MSLLGIHSKRTAPVSTLSFEVPLNIDVLGVGMETEVTGECKRTLIISYDKHCFVGKAESNVKFGEQPSKLLGSLSLSHILSLTCR